MKQFFGIVLLFLVWGCGTAQTNSKGVQVISQADFDKKVIGKEVQLVDVRTYQEFAGGKIDDAINIDFLSSDFKQKMAKLDKNQPVYIYCQSGNRSGKASQIMVEMGFKQIYDLQGGYGGYRK